MGTETGSAAQVVDPMTDITGPCAVWVKGGFQTIARRSGRLLGPFGTKIFRAGRKRAHERCSQFNDEEQLR
jgi:hypothetical protein